MKIGLIYTSYNCQEYLRESIAAWTALKKEMGNDLLIASVSVPFEEYKDLAAEDVETGYFLTSLSDFIVLEPKYVKEHQARDKAFQWLKSQNVDYVMLWDGDEIATIEQLKSVIGYIQNYPFITWFSFSYKNYIWDKKHYLAESFCPPRVFKMNTGVFEANKMSWDNDIVYLSKQNDFISYTSLSNKNIPKTVAHFKHYTWLNDERSKNKIQYQIAHFSDKSCSYSWNDVTKSVEFNLDFYRHRGLSVPEIKTDIDVKS